MDWWAHRSMRCMAPPVGALTHAKPRAASTTTRQSIQSLTERAEPLGRLVRQGRGRDDERRRAQQRHEEREGAVAQALGDHGEQAQRQHVVEHGRRDDDLPQLRVQHAEVAHELRGHANGRRRQRRAAQQPLARPEGRQQRQGRPGRRERQHGPGQRDGERDFPDAPQRRELDVEPALEHEQREADGADERERLVVGDGVQALRAQHHAGDDLADERRRRQPARDGAEEPGREHEEDDGERPQERVGHRCDAGGRRRSTMRARTGALRLPAVHHSRVHVNGQTRVQPCASLTFWLGSTQWIYTMALASP